MNDSTTPLAALPRPLRQVLWALALLGAAAFVVGLFVAPLRALSSALVCGFYFASIAVGALVFLSLMAVANASWHVVLKRIPEAVSLALPVGALGLVLVLPGLSVVYPWAAAEAGADHLLHEKHAWLNAPAFAVRMVALLGVWWAFAAGLRRTSLRQDVDGQVGHTRRAVALSALCLVVVGVTFSMASFDWLMSTEPHWFSTIYALYSIAGALAAGTAAITLAVLALRRAGLMPELTESHLHDLGKLTFGFCTLWAYMWLSQYLLIWYANLPEETSYYLAREGGGWSFLFWMNVLLGWGIPFVLLLSRRGKRSEPNLAWACGFLLAGRWLDIYLMAAPGTSPEHAGIGLAELAILAGFGALFVLALVRGLRAAPLIPRGDPYLQESLHHHA